ncbi:MAG: hypothetical protein JNK09_21310 [Prolixibacteraceae bacterium]|nr:hypothetical protein [Prolixibacteraceae bacterium]
MKKAVELSSDDLSAGLTQLAKRLGIDTQRYQPVRFENFPFFSVYCVDLNRNTNQKEWITKFEILLIDVDSVDDLFIDFRLNLSVEQKYLDGELDDVKVIKFPND